MLAKFFKTLDRHVITMGDLGMRYRVCGEAEEGGQAKVYKVNYMKKADCRLAMRMAK